MNPEEMWSEVAFEEVRKHVGLGHEGCANAMSRLPDNNIQRETNDPDVPRTSTDFVCALWERKTRREKSSRHLFHPDGHRAFL